MLLELLEQRCLLTRLAVIGDYSSDVQIAPTRDVANLIKSWNVDAVVTDGDNNYPDGEASTIDSNIGQWYHQFIHPYTGGYGAGSADGQNHFWPALGRHDWMTPNAQPYLDYFTLPGNERYYATQVGDIALFIVNGWQDPDGITATSAQANWLHGALAASTAPWKLVIFHPPAYTSGGEGNNLWMRWPFAQWGATAVISGHDHDYERLLEGGLTYFVDGLGGESIVGFSTPIAGSQVRYAGDYGAMQINSTETALDFKFITRSGVVIDDYTIALPPPGNNVNLIPTGATWKYLDNGTNQGTAWRALGFDDSSWHSGPAQLGYGDGDEATVVSFGPNNNNKYITTYFRKTFSIGDVSRIAALNLDILRDDGAVVYLNGTEVFRTNMPTGTISYTTTASSAIEDQAFYPSAINPALLVNGDNTIAVEIHQATKNSSDISFDFDLHAFEPLAWQSGSTLTVAFDAAGGLPITLGSSGSDVTVTKGTSTQTFSGVAAIDALGTGGNDTLQISGPLGAALSFSNGGGEDSVRLLTGASYTFAADLSPALHNVAVTVDAGASATFNAMQHLAGLIVDGDAFLSAGGDKLIITHALAVTGRLDLSDNDLVVDYSSVSPVGTWTGSAYDGVTGMIAASRLRSSAVTSSLYALGVAEASEALGITGAETALFDGETVDASSVVVKFTYGGDANLDGKINVDDYGHVDSAVGIALTGWFNGDFNLDGTINVDDYGVIDFNIAIQGPPL